jgi:hypothetical protein
MFREKPVRLDGRLIFQLSDKGVKMSGEKARILKMVADRVISINEAEELLDALSANSRPGSSSAVERPKAPVAESVPKNPKYMYVKVTGKDCDNVDVRVPLGLLRAGMRFTTLIPPHAIQKINGSLQEKGIPFDFNSLKPDDIDELIKNLAEMEVNVNSKTGENVRVYCS